jgi:hypothetical protein
MGANMRWRGRTDRSGIFFAAVASLAALAPAARAADLTVEAPASCVDPSTLVDEVGDLIGKPLASVADVGFRVRITQVPAGRWRLHLEMLAPRAAGDGAAAVRGSREIEGATCAELAGAASVAIAVSIRSIADAAAPPEPSPRGAPILTTQPTLAVRAPTTTTEARRPPDPWHASVALALVTDSGALPNTGLGGEIEGDIQRRSLRLALLATWFGSQNAVAPENAGGSFQLGLGAALGCFAPRWGRWTALACGGFELGRLAGTGLGVARPETGSALWRAARADLGLTAAVSANTAFLLRGGLALPLSRPEFVFNGTDLVYRPSGLAGRLTAGFELAF